MNIFSHVAGCAVIVSVVLGQGLGDGLDFKHQEATQPSQPAGISARGDRVDVPSQSSEQPDTSPGTWECWTPLQTVPCNHNLFVVDALSETDAWAAGEAGTFMHWDGIAWEPVPSSTLANLHAIDMLSTTDGWASGRGYNSTTGETGVPSPTSRRISVVSPASPASGWAVGAGGAILRFTGPTSAVQLYLPLIEHG